MHEQEHEEVTNSRAQVRTNRRATPQGTAAVWAAPVIVAATSAPALAASGGTITANKGTTAVQSDGGQFYDVNCAGLTVIPSTAVAAVHADAQLELRAVRTHRWHPVHLQLRHGPRGMGQPVPGTGLQQRRTAALHLLRCDRRWHAGQLQRDPLRDQPAHHGGRRSRHLRLHLRGSGQDVWRIQRRDAAVRPTGRGGQVASSATKAKA